MNVMKYLLRPNFRIRQIIAEMEHKLEEDGFELNPPCMVMNVQRKLGDLAKYMKVAVPVLEVLEAESVFLISDDSDGGDSFMKEVSAKSKFIFKLLPREDFTKDGKGEFSRTLLSLQLSARQCGGFVGDFSLPMSRLLYQWMCLVSETCPLYATLDGLEWNIPS